MCCTLIVDTVHLVNSKADEGYQRQRSELALEVLNGNRHHMSSAASQCRIMMARVMCSYKHENCDLGGEAGNRIDRGGEVVEGADT